MVQGSFSKVVSKVATRKRTPPCCFSEGTLYNASFQGGEPIPFVKADSTPYSDFQRFPNGVYAISTDKRRLDHIDLNGNLMESTYVGVKQSEIVRFDGGTLSYSMLTKSGHLLASIGSQGTLSNQVLATGHLRKCADDARWRHV